MHTELFSEQTMDGPSKDNLTKYLKKALPHEKDNNVLIVGGRCGLTADVLAPFCKQIDVV